MAALDDHIKDHENPAQSLPGKRSHAVQTFTLAFQSELYYTIYMLVLAISVILVSYACAVTFMGLL